MSSMRAMVILLVLAKAGAAGIYVDAADVAAHRDAVLAPGPES